MDRQKTVKTDRKTNITKGQIMYFTSVFRQTNLRKRKTKNFRVTNEQMEKLNRNSFYIFLYSLLLYVCLSCYLCKSLRLCVFVCVCVCIFVCTYPTRVCNSQRSFLSPKEKFFPSKKNFSKSSDKLLRFLSAKKSVSLQIMYIYWKKQKSKEYFVSTFIHVTCLTYPNLT